MARKRTRDFIKRFPTTILLLLTLLTQLYGQSNSNPKLDFAHLDSLWEQNKITKKAYMDSAEQYAMKYFRAGITLESVEYRKLLENFYKFTDTKPIDTAYRIKYFNILENNATMSDKYGESFYYSNKVLQLKSNPQDRNFKLLNKRLQYYTDREHFAKVAAVYKENMSIVDKKFNECMNIEEPTEKELGILFTLNFSGFALTEIKDSITLKKIEYQAKKLEPKFLNNKKLEDGVRALALFLTRSITILRINTFENNAAKTLAFISNTELDIKNILPAENNLLQNLLDNLNSIKIMVFIKNKQADSATYYLNKLDSASGQISLKDYIELGNLYAADNNLKKSNEYYQKSVNLLKNKLNKVGIELEGLLNAYIESDDRKIELLEAEKASNKKTLLILAITFIAIIVVMLLFLNMRKKAKEMENRVATLNYQTSIQIAELEDSKNKLQENLGRELHDSFASLLAGIKNKIEILDLDIQDKATKNTLKDIYEKMEEAYHHVRNKSHDLYQEGFEKSEQNFERRIIRLIDFSLPKKQYEKEIIIEKGAINQLKTDDKIEILKILQESITNILKHAKANKVSIVIYEEDGLISIAIKDNGKGLPANKKSGVGLESLKDRVQKIGGTTKIISEGKGTEILIQINNTKTQ